MEYIVPVLILLIGWRIVRKMLLIPHDKECDELRQKAMEDDVKNRVDSTDIAILIKRANERFRNSTRKK